MYFVTVNLLFINTFKIFHLALADQLFCKKNNHMNIN